MRSGLFFYPDSERGRGSNLTHKTNSVDSPAPELFIPYEPEAKMVESWFEQFQKIIAIAQLWKQSLPLMEWVNSLQLDVTRAVTVDEIKEVIEELNSSSLIKFLAEWTDVINPLAGLAASLKLQIDLKDEVFARVNGQGKRSDVFTLAAEIGANLSSDQEKIIKDIQQIYILMLSALKHAPPFTANLVDLALKKMSDNVQNYPQEVFSVFDESQISVQTEQPQLKELNADEKNQKYLHVVKCLKWLRSLEPGRMLPEDWRLVKPFILAFRSSDQSYSMLQTEWLRIHPEKLEVKKPVLVYAGSEQGVFLPA